jgi:hypothetical protein
MLTYVMNVIRGRDIAGDEVGLALMEDITAIQR